MPSGRMRLGRLVYGQRALAALAVVALRIATQKEAAVFSQASLKITDPEIKNASLGLNSANFRSTTMQHLFLSTFSTVHLKKEAGGGKQ